MSKNQRIIFVLVILTLSLCDIAYAEDPFLEAMKIAFGNGEAFSNPQYGEGFVTRKPIFEGRFLVSIGVYPKAEVVEVTIASKEARRIVMLSWNISLDAYKLMAGSIDQEHWGTKKLITSTYAKLLCREFLDYWDEIKEPPSNWLREIPR